MGSKGKKRMVLPTRPDPPSVVQIIEDLNRAHPNDPVFSILQDTVVCSADLKEGSNNGEVESRYLQSRRYLELNERLQEARTDLVWRREELRTVGESLEHSVAEVKGRAV